MIRKTVQESVKDLKVNPHYEMCVGNMQDVCKENDLYKIMCLTFRFGYLQGTKAARKKAVKI